MTNNQLTNEELTLLHSIVIGGVDFKEGWLHELSPPGWPNTKVSATLNGLVSRGLVDTRFDEEFLTPWISITDRGILWHKRAILKRN